MVQEILEVAPPSFALAGHSMGGWLCLEVMRSAPERVVKLGLLNTTSRSDSEEKRLKRKAMIARVKAGEFPKLVEEITDHFVFRSQVKNDVKKMFLEVGEQAFINQQEAMSQRRECSSLLPLIRCPTLVIHANRDKNFSLEEHRELAEKIVQGQLAVVEDSGHMSPMEQPHAVTALLREWLIR